MNISLSTAKIPQRQEQKIGRFIFWQNWLLPKAALSPEPLASPLGDIKQPPSPPPSIHPPLTPPTSPYAKGREEEGGEGIGQKGVNPTLRSGKVGGMGQMGQRGGQEEMGQGKGPVEYEEIPRAKGLKLGDGQGKISNIQFPISKKPVLPSIPKPQTSLNELISRSPSPVSSPSRERRDTVEIDRKLEELKKKARGKTIND